MKAKRTLAVLAVATGALAACSGTSEEAEVDTGPLSNEDAIPLVLEQTVGKTPTGMLQLIAGNFYPTFETARELGGEAAADWDEARFKSEIASAFEPLSQQIDASFAASIASQMEEGEAQALLDVLEQGNNRDFALCIFDAEGPPLDNPFQGCAFVTGVEPSQQLQDGLGTIAGQLGQAIQGNPLMGVAVGYVTCSVLAKFGREVSTESRNVDLGTTEIGIGPEKLPCTAYDTLAAEQLSGDIKPNFASGDTP